MGYPEVRALYRALLTGDGGHAEIAAWQEEDTWPLAVLSTTVCTDVFASRFISPDDPRIRPYVERLVNGGSGQADDVPPDRAEAVVRAALGARTALRTVPVDEIVPTQLMLTAAALADDRATESDVDAALLRADPLVAATVASAAGQQPPRPAWRRALPGVTAGGVVAVVLALLVAFAGVTAQTKDHVWTVDGWGDADAHVLRTYLVGESLVRISRLTMTAHDLGDGKTRWRVQHRGIACAAVPQASRGVVAVLFGTVGCDHVAAVEAATGTVLWTAKLRGRGTGGEDADEEPHYAVTMAGNRVVVADSWNLESYDARTGERQWRARPGTAEECGTRSVASNGSLLYATTDCNDANGNDSVGNVVSLDTASGTIRWEQPAGGIRASIANVEPLLVRVYMPDELRVYDEHGDVSAIIPTEDEVGGFIPGGGTLDKTQDGNRVFDLRVSDGTILGVLQGSEGQGSTVNARAVAFAVDDGEQRWTSDLGEASVSWVRSSDPDHITLVETGSLTRDPYLVDVDVHSGEVDEGPTVVPAPGDQLDYFGTDYVLADGTLLGIRTSQNPVTNQEYMKAYR